jgi:hypothetical protein
MALDSRGAEPGTLQKKKDITRSFSVTILQRNKYKKCNDRMYFSQAEKKKLQTRTSE